MKYSLLGCVLCIWFIAGCCSLIAECEARGGRGRGSGSFGGLFGGWRKYKKPSSSSNGRRVLSGSPMHTAMTSASATGSNSMGKKVATAPKQSKASYPKQQALPPPPPPPYTPYAAHGYGQAYQPAAGTYYANTAALPAGAVYYAQPPMRSSGNGDFLMGMLTGHMLNSMLYSPGRQVTHIYQRNEPGNENAPQQANAGSPQMIVIENGQQPDADETEADPHEPLYWPMASDPPLAALNVTLLPSEVAPTGDEVIFQRPALNSQLPNLAATLPTAATATAATATTATATAETATAATATAATATAATESPTATTSATPPQSGIVCFPILINETNPEEPEEYVEVEKIVCFPKPVQQAPYTDCVMRTYDEPDPTDPTKIIAVQREDCLLFGSAHSTTTTEPPIVAGDIGSGAENIEDLLEPQLGSSVRTIPVQENI